MELVEWGFLVSSLEGKLKRAIVKEWHGFNDFPVHRSRFVMGE